MANYFYCPKLSKIVTDLENEAAATIAEAKKSAGAMSTLQSEAENIRYVLAKFERVIAKAESENTSGSSAGVLN